MGFFSKFENKMEDTFDNLGDKMFDAPISPVQIAKKAEKQMRRGKMVGAGKQYAPTLYTVLVNEQDDQRLSGYYPTLAGETETYLKAKANEAGLAMDGQPLVRFFTDPDLKSGKFDVIAEAVSSAIVEQLRVEEITNYGINKGQDGAMGGAPAPAANQGNAQNQHVHVEGFAPAPANMQAGGAQPQGSQPQAGAAQPQASQPQNQNFEQGDPFAPHGSFEEFQQQGEQYEKNASNANADYSAQPNADQPAPQQAAPQPDMQPAPQPDMQPAPEQDFGQPAQAVAPQSDISQPASAPTMVFAGGMNVAPGNGKIPVSDVPPAHLRDNASGKVYTLNASTIVLGRDNTCGVVIPDANASRQHAQILFNQGVWMLNDLGSTNGTYINDQEITTRQLNSGDIITIGVTHLTFNIG